MNAEPTSNQNPESRPEASDGSSILSRPERVKAIKEHLGFYPQSNDEASRVTGLIGREDQSYPVLRHLDEVYKHQRTAGADAPGAIRSLVRGFETYAGNAVNELHYMDTFLGELSQINPNNRAGFTSIFPVDDWRYDNTQIAAFTSMSRYLETDHFAETETDDRLGKRQLIDLTSGEARVERIVENLQVLRASNLKKVATAVEHNQQNRLAFWTEQLEASKKHLFARNVASAALSEINRIQY